MTVRPLSPKVMSILGGCSVSSAEQTASQQGLHVPTPIDDEVDDDLPADDTVDHAVGLERSLAVLLDAQCHKFFWVAATFGELSQPLHDHHQPVKHVVGVGHAVEFSDVIADGLQVLLRALGEQNL